MTSPAREMRAFFKVLYTFISMFVPTEATIITAVIGMIGLFGSAVVLTYGFVR